MKKEHKNTVIFASIIVAGFSILLLILGPREKRGRSRGSATSSWTALKKKLSIHKDLLRKEKGSLDTLVIVTDSITKRIPVPYSREIKFILDTAKSTNKKIVLFDTASKKSIRFRIEESQWRGLNQKPFRWIKMF